MKDIVQRAGIKDIELFGRTMEYLVCNPSQIFSPQSMSDYFLSINRKVSKETIYNYLEHITSSLIMTKASRYDIRGKRILTKMDNYPKYVLSFDKMDFSRDGIIHKNVLQFLLGQ